MTNPMLVSLIVMGSFVGTFLGILLIALAIDLYNHWKAGE